ncbi:MAG: hypothetical protein GY722_17520 [bacterium]|nr:hypothetical protein [bacterium]
MARRNLTLILGRALRAIPDLDEFVNKRDPETIEDLRRTLDDWIASAASPSDMWVIIDENEFADGTVERRTTVIDPETLNDK